MSALAPLVGVKRTSPVEPAPRYLVPPGDGETNFFAGLIEHHT